MANMQVKRIGVLSFAKVYAVVMAGVALVVVIPIGIITMIVGAAASTRDPGALGGVVGGVAMMVIAPVLYGVVGFIFGALMALIYNIAAGFVGGIELELEGTDTSYGAPPPPQWDANTYQPGQQQYPYS